MSLVQAEILAVLNGGWVGAGPLGPGLGLPVRSRHRRRRRHGRSGLAALVAGQGRLGGLVRPGGQRLLSPGAGDLSPGGAGGGGLLAENVSSPLWALPFAEGWTTWPPGGTRTPNTHLPRSSGRYRKRKDVRSLEAPHITHAALPLFRALGRV